MQNHSFHDQTTLPDITFEEKVVTPIPATVGPYKIESLLNKGGMSILYLAVDPKTSKPLVIKVLSPKYVKHKEVVDRFLKEAKIIAMTDHPNIVKLYDQGPWEKGLYIAMEFIQGVSLRQFILQKSLSQKKALQIILQVAYALCHLHTHGVIHRDLKPENILICESGQIKVIDFGIAQVDTQLDQERITQRKRFMGTPIYMSPEQKEDPQKVSYASDIYSLGIITYELVLGRLSHGVIHLSLLPYGLRKIIENALKINPEERYQDIVDFISDISNYLKNYDEQGNKEIEAPEEIVETLTQEQNILMPKKAPVWPQLEIGIMSQEGLFLTGFYSDFFKIDHNRFVIILAEPNKTGISSLIHTAVLRGMVRMIIDSKEDKLSPITTVSRINNTLFKDPMQESFSFDMLLLDPEKDQLSLILCHYNNLLHIPAGGKTIRTLSSPNPKLGVQKNITLLETSDNWNVGDILILHSLAIETKKESDESLNDFILQNHLQSAKTLSEKILKFCSLEAKDRPPYILTIKRIF